MVCKQNKGQKSSQLVQKKPLTKFNILHDINSEETRNKWKVPQNNKGYISKTYAQCHTK
jgi:hypothetical protein